MQRLGGEAVLREKYAALAPVLNERSRRLWAATEARALGRGGQTRLAKVMGLSRSTLHRGLQELAQGADHLDPLGGRVRSPGGGRKPLTYHQPLLPQAREALGEPTSRGDPQSPWRWTSKSVRQLAAELTAQGYDIGRQKVADVLHDLGYSLHANRKSQEGGTHPDRNAQFESINAQVQAFQEQGQPVVSVDAQKKELVGEFKNGGREWCPQGEPVAVRVHDFVASHLGKAIPYGVYDLTANTGGVSVGLEHDTAEFAGETLRRWWRHMGAAVYPKASALLITADGGGSNGSRCRLWKVTLQRLTDDLGLHITVWHFPPGTSKWNKIEHRLFSHIAINWRGQPLASLAVIVKLIANTTTRQGLYVQADLDTNPYPTGIVVTAQQLAEINLKRADFHGDWNYTIHPRTTPN
jgi:Rhodopirellula transposase DDE domain